MPDNKQNQNPSGEEPETSRTTELEGLIAEKDEQLAAKDLRLSELEQAIASKDNQIAALKQSMAELEQKLTDLENSLSQVVSSYRALAAEVNPEVLGELITGNTVEDINASLEKAKTLVSRVKEGLEAEIASVRVPAGAPERAPINLEALSPREKIEYAIGGRR